MRSIPRGAPRGVPRRSHFIEGKPAYMVRHVRDTIGGRATFVTSKRAAMEEARTLALRSHQSVVIENPWRTEFARVDVNLNRPAQVVWKMQ